MRRIIAFVGRPGAGKTTYSERLREEIDGIRISGGDVARNAAKTDPDVARALEKGKMAPPVIMDRLMMREIGRVRNANKAIIVDGYPRYWSQLADLMLVARELDAKLNFIHIECEIEVALNRLKIRGRGDPDPERMKEYYELTQPLVKWLHARDLAVGIMNTDHKDDINKNMFLLKGMYS